MRNSQTLTSAGSTPSSKSLTRSRYAFPPLLKQVIAKDIDLSVTQVNNSNIVALVGTLFVRVLAGPACDRFDPRLTFACSLLIGAVPTFLSGAATNAAEIYVIRFFTGILGGTFVPCQIWTTAFFDTNVVGTANALTAGFGNAGGGVTYFVMPAIFAWLVDRDIAPRVAWRVTFIVPGVFIVVVALLMLALCPDTPVGKWSDRAQAIESNAEQFHASGASAHLRSKTSVGKKPSNASSGHQSDAARSEQNPSHLDYLILAQSEQIHPPTVKDFIRIWVSPQTIVTSACYFCSFGPELAINSILGDYFYDNFPSLCLQGSGAWAAMFGLMNVFFRPLGGVIADWAYRGTSSVWSKKFLLHVYGVLSGAFLIALGASKHDNLATMVGLINVGAGFFLEGGNGLDYSLVPHVHPRANGVVSGFTGACGNLGGIVFAIFIRYHGDDYDKSMWIIGVMVIAINVAVCWIKPTATSHIGKT